MENTFDLSFERERIIPSLRKQYELPVVNSYNEWDPLEEVIVGVVEGSTVPSWHISLDCVVPEKQKHFYKQFGGKPFPQDKVKAARKDLDEFVHILEAEGVIVNRPVAVNFSIPFSTMEWSCPGGFYAAMPRDLLLVIGNEIIETPMAWRSRYFEVFAFRNVLKDYFKKGARWTAAPKPQLNDKLYNYDYREPSDGEEMKYVITEFEPSFDAADFIRCGRDIFAQKSHVTNDFGIDWLRRHLGNEFNVHVIEVNDKHPMHIDASFFPLAPGKLLINPERIIKIPDMFRSWDVLYAPKPCIPKNHTLYMTSPWINMNVFMLDHKRVMIEKNDIPMFKALKDFGFEPIPCPFLNFNTFGGSFHCATLDIRRRGGLESYF